MALRVLAVLLLATGCVRQLHEACTPSSRCAAGTTCLPWIRYESLATCEQPCTEDAQCPRHHVCTASDGIGSGSVCLVPVGLPKLIPLHERCDENSYCAVGWCEQWRDAKGHEIRRCEFRCDAADPPSTACPDGYRCEHPEEGPSRCFRKEDAS